MGRILPYRDEATAADYPGRVSNSRRSGNPARRAAATAPPESTARTVINNRSKSLLVRLSRLPRWLVPGVMLGLMLVGLAAPVPYAVPALVIIAAFVLWLAVVSWPVLTGRGKSVRALMVGVLLACAAARVYGWL
ncbi:MAG: DUF6703 family protein [Nocardioidaceae bacterium]